MYNDSAVQRSYSREKCIWREIIIFARKLTARFFSKAKIAEPKLALVQTFDVSKREGSCWKNACWWKMDTAMYVCMCVRVGACMYKCVYIFVCVCVCFQEGRKLLEECMLVENGYCDMCMCVCVCVRVYVCACVCICVCVCVCHKIPQKFISRT